MIQVFIDLDNVTADFYGSPLLAGQAKRGYGQYPEMYEPGFFENLPPVQGCLSAVRQIISMFPNEVYILTQPVAETYYSYSEKAAWIKKWFPELRDKIIMTQHKELISYEDRILIDDNAKKWKDKWESKGGKFIWFNESICSKREWSQIVMQLETMKREQEETQC